MSKSVMKTCLMEELKMMEANMNQPVKRKRIVLTLEEKLEVIKMSDKGTPHELISQKFNIGNSTVKDILGKRAKIEAAVSKDRKFGLNRKVLKEGKKPEVEESLYNYVCEQNKKGEIVTNKDLIDAATLLNTSIHKEKWIPSKGWLGKFKARYSLTNRPNEQNQIVEISTETTYKDESDNVEIIEEEETPALQVTIDKKSPQICEISAANAADILLEFMTEQNYPLKEIITMRIMRDKIQSNPQSQTLYEVIQNQDIDQQQEDDEVELLVKYDNEIE